MSATAWPMPLQRAFSQVKIRLLLCAQNALKPNQITLGTEPFARLIAQKRRAPSDPSAKAHKPDNIAALKFALAHSGIQSQRDAQRLYWPVFGPS